ncbi:MAG TPA: carboxypeptidase regulatory-like domain-containing protein [Candidatus Limnocylindrales bacterium]
MVKSRVRGLCLIIAGAIAVNLALVAPAQAEDTTGSITGVITDSTGAAAPNVTVFASRDDGSSFAYVNTGGTGSYLATGLKPGKFTLEFTTFWGGIVRYAGTVEVVAGGQTVVDYTLPATGSLAGRLTRPDGSAAAGFQVRADGHRHSATTDADGNWRIDPVFAVETTVSFQNFGQLVSQYAFGKLDFEAADRIAVAPGVTTIVNDTLLPTGTVRVTATDSVSGAPVAGFFAFIRMHRASEQDGVAVLSGVPIGTHLMAVSAQGYLGVDAQPVTVVAGQEVSVAVKLVPEAQITATVVDAATGQPLPGVCVAAVSPQRIPSEGCGPTSDETGQVSITGLGAGTYRLFAMQVEAPGYGAQWVGPNGGTGRQHRAATITVAAGQTATGPVIRMDRAGTVTGTLTKADGSLPVPGQAFAGLLPIIRTSVNEEMIAAAPTDTQGRYTLDFLGPYEWELFFTEPNEAAQWSGGVANQRFATPVRVRAGQTGTYNFKFRPAVTVTLVITGIDLPPRYFTMAANSLTGYPVARQFAPDEPTNQVKLLLVGPQFAKFQVATRFFGGADFADARTFWIPASGSRTFTLAY